MEAKILREKELYRDILEDLLSYTEGKRLMSCSEVGQYLGLTRQTVSKRYGIGRDGVTVVCLARLLANQTVKDGRLLGKKVSAGRVRG